MLGNREADWPWQDGGVVELQPPVMRLALHDLTGFEGRCDALVFAADAALVPPNRDPEMAAFRHRALGQPDPQEEAGQFDLVVTGGGVPADVFAGRKPMRCPRMRHSLQQTEYETRMARGGGGAGGRPGWLRRP